MTLACSGGGTAAVVALRRWWHCGGGGTAAVVASYPITPGAATGGTFTAANYSIDYVPGTLTVNPRAPTKFGTWAAESAQGLTVGVDDGLGDDPDHDGVSNLLEFVLGGEPMVSSQAILPKTAKPAGIWIFSYDRSGHSKSSTTQVVEYGSNLTGWTPLAVPGDSAGGVVITPGTSSDHVQVTLPDLGAKGCARLRVSQ